MRTACKRRSRATTITLDYASVINGDYVTAFFVTLLREISYHSLVRINFHSFPLKDRLMIAWLKDGSSKRTNDESKRYIILRNARLA